MINLVIDKRGDVSIHRQIVNQICTMIDSHQLKGGDRLPTERMLSEKYEISRGTVKAAYQELMRIGKIYAVQGSGTYIREAQPNVAQGNVRTLLSNTLEIAVKAGVSYEYVQELLRQEYESMLSPLRAVKVCWIGVTREVLEVAGDALAHVEHVQLTGHLQEDIYRNPCLLDSADIIVTTEHGYEQVLRISGTKADKVLRLSLALDEECIVGIARKCVGRRVLLCDMDSLFMEWVHSVEGMWDPAASVAVARSDDPALMEAAQKSDMLVLPCRDAFAGDKRMLALERCFRESGRPVSYVSFHFDRGSMIHFQSQVLRVWAQKEGQRGAPNR